MPRQNLLYKTVYHAICTRIFTGEFQPGTRLPSMNELAQTYNVSIITIRATFKMLQEIGLIRVSRGKEAMVVYDAADPASKRSFLHWLAGRAYTLSEVYYLTARLASGSVAYGASIADAETLDKLEEIAGKVRRSGLAVNRLALLFVEYFFTALQPLHNELLLDLLRSCDAAVSVSMLLVAQDEGLCAQYSRSLRDFVLEAHTLIGQNAFSRVQRRIMEYAVEMRGEVLEYIDRLTEGYAVPPELHFNWTISGNENLYTEIANDLILRISTGEFFDGDYLPSEQRLQKEYATSSKTIRSALIALNDCDIVRTINGVGTLVTYLSPSEPPERFQPDPHEAYILFHALQLVMLGSTGLVRDAFPTLSDEEVETTRLRVERLLNAPDRCFYSYLGILLNIGLQNCPHELTRRIYRQFHTRLFLLCHKRKHFTEIFKAHLDRSMPYITDALVKLQARDAEGYLQNIKKILGLVGQSTLQICEVSGLYCEVVLPF